MDNRRAYGRMLTAAEEADLFKAYKEGDRRAGDRIVRAHEPLADKMAWRISRSGRDIDDLRQEARAGLVRALDKFDTDAGVRFNSYARHWIRAALSEYLIKSHSMVSVSGTADAKRLFFNLRSTKARLGIFHDGDLTHDEVTKVAEDLGTSVDEVVRMNRQLSPGFISSVDAPAGQEEGAARIDLIADPSANVEDLHERLDTERTAAQVREILRDLKPREREIVERRTIGEATLQDLADTFGVTRERIRQVEVKTMEKIRRALVRNHGYAI